MTFVGIGCYFVWNNAWVNLRGIFLAVWRGWLHLHREEWGRACPRRNTFVPNTAISTVIVTGMTANTIVLVFILCLACRWLTVAIGVEHGHAFWIQRLGITKLSSDLFCLRRCDMFNLENGKKEDMLDRTNIFLSWDFLQCAQSTWRSFKKKKSVPKFLRAYSLKWNSTYWLSLAFTASRWSFRIPQRKLGWF